MTASRRACASAISGSTGWPDRLYVIDGAGKIAHKSKAGPFGFKPAEVETTLKAQLSSLKFQVSRLNGPHSLELSLES